MRLLQLISSGGHYGAENMLINLTGALEQLGCRSVVGVFENAHRPNTEIAEHAGRRGLPAVVFQCMGRADWRAVRTVRNYIETEEIDLVHTHGYKADIYGYAATKPLKVPIIATCHNWTKASAALRIYAFFDRLVLRRFERAVAVSEHVAAALHRSGVPAERITTIHNGVDVAAFSTAPATVAAEINKGKRPVVGMVARLVRGKGIEHFLSAAREALAAFPEAIFLIVGEGLTRKHFEKMTRAMGIQENVLFLGQRNDLPGVYASMDIFVLPSLNEGMPLTILEALAAKKAVIASRVGAIPQAILDRETGILITPGDTAALKNAMVELLRDPSLRVRLGAQGQTWVRRHFEVERMARDYLRLYEELIEAAPRSSSNLEPIHHAAGHTREAD